MACTHAFDYGPIGARLDPTNDPPGVLDPRVEVRYIYTGCRVTGDASGKVVILRENYRIKFFHTTLCFREKMPYRVRVRLIKIQFNGFHCCYLY